MCKLAGVGTKDLVVDLGCGDGVVLLTAVRDFQARAARGIDVDPRLVHNAREGVKKAGLEKKITITEGNVLKMKPDDLKDASVVMLYLGNELNTRLRPFLWEHLPPGTRIVSHRFLMGDWQSDKSIDVIGADGDTYTLHLWTITGKEKAGEYRRTKKPENKPSRE